MPKKCLPLAFPSLGIFSHDDLLVLLFLKLLEIQSGWNWLNFSGHVHLGTRSRDICFSFHGSLSFESYG